MATAEFRSPALNLFDAEWRRALWRRWLGSRVWGQSTASAPTPTPAPAAAAEAAPAVLRSEAELRRGEVRARFDSLFDRLIALEDTLDALGKRFTLRAAQDRRHDQRFLERLESTSESLERQTIVLESTASALERIEQRVERIERRLLSEGAPSETASARESRVAPRPGLDEFEEFERALSGESLPRPGTPLEVEPWDPSVPGVSSIRGNLSEMSLPTVLGMLELERRTGVLRVIADDGAMVSMVLKDGALAGSRSHDVEVDPIDALRESLRFTNGRFWFRQASVEVVNGAPRSVGSVLLEATRKNDEARRSA